EVDIQTWARYLPPMKNANEPPVPDISFLSLFTRVNLHIFVKASATVNLYLQTMYSAYL
ncbi:unnamed protein product, partial [Musa acuminata subsp. burmannicoides]